MSGRARPVYEPLEGDLAPSVVVPRSLLHGRWMPDLVEAGVLELYLVSVGVVRQAAGLQAGDDAYEARQQHKQALADKVVNGCLRLLSARRCGVDAEVKAECVCKRALVGCSRLSTKTVIKDPC